jgi:uncharacterized protein with HEPN domain
MSQHDPLVALRHMLDHAREAAELARERTRAELDANRLLHLALSRLVEIIGEAASRVPGEVQERHPELPWREAIGARNRLIHGYDFVDLDILWEIVATDLPLLVTQVEQVLEAESARRGGPP